MYMIQITLLQARRSRKKICCTSPTNVKKYHVKVARRRRRKIIYVHISDTDFTTHMEVNDNPIWGCTKLIPAK